MCFRQIQGHWHWPQLSKTGPWRQALSPGSLQRGKKTVGGESKFYFRPRGPLWPALQGAEWLNWGNDPTAVQGHWMVFLPPKLNADVHTQKIFYLAASHVLHNLLWICVWLGTKRRGEKKIPSVANRVQGLSLLTWIEWGEEREFILGKKLR